MYDGEAERTVLQTHFFGDLPCYLPLLCIRCDGGVDVVADEGAELVVLGCIVQVGSGELGEEGFGEGGGGVGRGHVGWV